MPLQCPPTDRCEEHATGAPARRLRRDQNGRLPRPRTDQVVNWPLLSPPTSPPTESCDPLPNVTPRPEVTRADQPCTNSVGSSSAPATGSVASSRLKLKSA